MEYHLQSNPMVFAPGVVKFALHLYKFKSDQERAIDIICSWGVPRSSSVALLSGKVQHEVVGETVVFKD